MIPLPEFVQRLRQKIDAATDDVAAGLLRGDPETLADYKQGVGLINGLRQARQELDELVRTVNEGG